MNFLMKCSSIIYFPLNSKIVISSNKKKINQKVIHVLQENGKKLSFFYNNNLFVNKWNNSIILLKNKANVNQNIINKIMNSFIKTWDFFFFNKIKFKGKGFRIKFFKKTKLIKFYFGRSHKTFFLLKKIKRKKINKYKFIVYGLSNQNVNYITKKITDIKKFNVYTLRGLRKSRQIIFKRKGKKGTYI